MDRGYLALILNYFQEKRRHLKLYLKNIEGETCRPKVIYGMGRSIGHSACDRTRYVTSLMIHDNCRISCQCLSSRVPIPQHAYLIIPQS